MVITMDMTSGTPRNAMQSDSERYGDEVLNANWLPQPALGLQCANTPARVAYAAALANLDIDDFLARLYRAQE
jgi:hypothetical protein